MKGPDRTPPKNAGAALHQALVYDDPLELVRTIGDSSAAALERGDAVLFVAGQAHLQASDEWIRLSGAFQSAGTVLEDGRYQTFDADVVLAQLGIATDPVTRFRLLLDSACQKIPAGVGAVHVYDDLVGALWARGQTDLALEIERVSCQLAEERGFFFMCAYPASALKELRVIQ